MELALGVAELVDELTIREPNYPNPRLLYDIFDLPLANDEDACRLKVEKLWGARRLCHKLDFRSKTTGVTMRMRRKILGRTLHERNAVLSN